MKFPHFMNSTIVMFLVIPGILHAEFNIDAIVSSSEGLGYGFQQYAYPLAALAIILLGTIATRAYKNKEFPFQKSRKISSSQKKIAVAPDSLVIRVGRNKKVEFTNVPVQQLIGKANEELIGSKSGIVLKQLGVSSMDTDVILKMVKQQFLIKDFGLNHKDIVCELNGNKRTFHVSSAPILNSSDNVISVALIGQDQAVQQKMMEKLIGQAERDHLTGLVNRMGFDKFIEEFPKNVRPGSKNVICYMDLDNFKPVNDSAGHAAGDELLKQLSDVFRQHVRASDLLARTGGDEFVVVFPDCPIEKAKSRCENMINSVSSLRFSWGDKSFVVGVSMGAVEFDAGVNVAGLHDLCKIADEACYMAKQRGRNQLCVHQPEHPVGSSDHMGTDNWQEIIRDSLDNNKFQLFVQPIIPLGGSDSNGNRDGKKRYEVYLRLPYNGRVLRPGSFFPAAERYGLSRSIDRWVVRRTMERLAKIISNSDGSAVREFTINLSSASLLDEGFSAFVTEQLDRFSLNASSLCFEVSEADVISNFSQARKLLTKLATIGCSNSLDDFGSGLSALNYIRDLPIHYLKIDGVFVRNIETNQIDAAMIHSLSHMSKAMNLKTVAEFVEDEHTAKLLQRLGVDFAQGYYCGRPLPLERLEQKTIESM